MPAHQPKIDDECKNHGKEFCVDRIAAYMKKDGHWFVGDHTASFGSLTIKKLSKIVRGKLRGTNPEKLQKYITAKFVHRRKIFCVKIVNSINA